MLRSLLVLALVACGGAPEPTAHDHADHVAHEAPPAPAAHAADGEAHAGLALDAGKKWLMDEHTRATFAEIRTLVTGAEVATTADAATLAGALDGKLGTLIAGCTMSGAAHDQLHVFLTDFMPAVKALGESPEIEQARERLAGLRRQVEQYDAHFE